ncbi:siphovirus ReqiPepy6 Gp37-like family protein [Nonomuraea lactucae]|uniref:siphovirus ReqiPepy6 Gp37-like family protein n=1 Tax=Nonomuraea lactucae TaxID=2249762 RepID=UPI0013B44C7A|nr:siphovirus ReqiPepy6 Gp37-like family protein [Nonomuraea lactucae]
MPKFFLEARDAFYIRVGVVEQYTSLDVISRFNNIGSWTLTVPADSREASILQPGGGIIIWIEGVARPVMSGPTTGVTRAWSADQPGRGLVTYTGVSDEWLLWSRITLPVPGNTIANQTADRYSLTGPAAAALRQLVNVNAGPAARADRIIPNLDAPSQSFGRTLSVSTRFDVLGVKCAEVAASAGIGWRLRQGTTDRLTFEPYTPRVHDDGEVVFSPDAGTLASYSYRLAAPTASRAILAAQGEGRNRWLRQYDDPSPAPHEWFRTPLERFVDRRDVPVAQGADGSPVDPENPSTPADPEALAQLDQAAAEALAESQALGELSVTPIDTDLLRYGVHYQVGDVVTVDIHGQVVTDVLREVRLTDGADGPRVQPVIGTDGASATPGLYREVRRIWNSIKKLEARR